MKEYLTFEECVKIVVNDEDFMREYKRLNPYFKVDEKNSKKLFDFIRDYMWIPALKEQWKDNSPLPQ